MLAIVEKWEEILRYWQYHRSAPVFLNHLLVTNHLWWWWLYLFGVNVKLRDYFSTDFSPHLCYCCRTVVVVVFFWGGGGVLKFLSTIFFLATKFNPEMSGILILVFVNEGCLSTEVGWYFIELERGLNDTKEMNVIHRFAYCIFLILGVSSFLYACACGLVPDQISSQALVAWVAYVLAEENCPDRVGGLPSRPSQL